MLTMETNNEVQPPRKTLKFPVFNVISHALSHYETLTTEIFEFWKFVSISKFYFYLKIEILKI